jgi:hypothetical protein
MPALKNPRHEQFAREIAKGKTLEEAHGLAGYRVDRRNAQHLRHRDDISRRVSELLFGKIGHSLAQRLAGQLGALTVVSGTRAASNDNRAVARPAKGTHASQSAAPMAPPFGALVPGGALRRAVW